MSCQESQHDLLVVLVALCTLPGAVPAEIEILRTFR